MTDNVRMRFFGTLHPAVSMCCFVCVIGLTLACPHVVTVLLSLLGGAMFNLALRGGKAFGRTMRFVLPMFLIVCIGNPLVNHRGVTMLFLLFDQWITLEAIVYGVVTACSLAAVILWFGCYQEVMTSDKFLYLFGKIAPATALLITSALRFIPQMQQNAAQIKESRAMLQDIQQFHVRGVQLRTFGVTDHIGVALLLDLDPERLCHLVEDTSNAPLHGGALHCV